MFISEIYDPIVLVDSKLIPNKLTFSSKHILLLLFNALIFKRLICAPVSIKNLVYLFLLFETLRFKSTVDSFMLFTKLI